jgi:glycosyltransferase involved in cell wall biosynthesis
MPDTRPKLLVFTTLFPHSGRPNAGLFIRERMFRVGRQLPLIVVSPQPWFPFQGILQSFRPHFRPGAPHHEIQDGIEVFYPRFFSVPGLFKSFDGLFMALGSLFLLRRLKQRFDFDLIDAHFAYPDGYAAVLLGKWLQVPVTITLRGTEVPLSRIEGRRQLIIKALQLATRVFSVSASLKQHVVDMGIAASKIRVVGNGVDLIKFQGVNKDEARNKLGLPLDIPVLISVGALVERKGFHRVIECLPNLCQQFPGLRYLIVGGAGPEGDWSQQLRQQVIDLGLEAHVTFLGPMLPRELKIPLSAADVFVLATRNEGWANVFLEAMACGLPVVTTDVGGNAEVVSSKELGMVVPFGMAEELQAALSQALKQDWDRSAIIAYAQANSWDDRVRVLTDEFVGLTEKGNPDKTIGTS